MELIVRILLVLHLLLTAFYIWDWYRDFGRLQEAAVRLILCLCLPCLGFLFCKLVDHFKEKYPAAQMDELYLGSGEMLDELSILRPVDARRERDKAPAVDTLRAGDYGFRRRMILDLLKGDDTVEYLSVLQEALANEDVETSHYASAVIMDLQKRIQMAVMERQRAFDEDPDDPERQEELEWELYQVIQSGAFDESGMARYRAQYAMVSDRLLAQPRPEARWLHNRVSLDLAAGDLLHAQETAARYVEAYPDDEDAVVDMIQVCLRLQDRKLLDEFLEKLRDMPVVLTNKSLQYIRFLNGTN